MCYVLNLSGDRKGLPCEISARVGCLTCNAHRGMEEWARRDLKSRRLPQGKFRGDSVTNRFMRIMLIDWGKLYHEQIVAASSYIDYEYTITSHKLKKAKVEPNKTLTFDLTPGLDKRLQEVRAELGLTREQLEEERERNTALQNQLANFKRSMAILLKGDQEEGGQ